MAASSTTIEVDSQTANALANYAAALGLSVQEYLRKHFADAQATDGIDDPDRWLEELTSGLPELSPLPRDFSAKDVYADHD